MELVKIPAGCFQMGSNNGGDDEKPVHRVCISEDYYLGQYEVTQGQWKAIMGSNPSYFKKGDKHPVESVSWNEVQTFIRKLNAKTGKHYRLPTEAEWEYACRSGCKDQTYCGSNSVGSVAWYGGNSGHKTHPVGQKQANGLGLYDMSGNVWEWVQDRYGGSYYQNSPVNDPSDPSGGSGRGDRGGRWGYDASNSRSAFRDRAAPTSSGNGLGFRLARTR
jgi:formylglycine-generating enzyme required for sulfatase activity